jgi:hypothetical protein
VGNRLTLRTSSGDQRCTATTMEWLIRAESLAATNHLHFTNLHSLARISESCSEHRIADLLSMIISNNFHDHHSGIIPTPGETLAWQRNALLLNYPCALNSAKQIITPAPQNSSLDMQVQPFTSFPKGVLNTSASFRFPSDTAASHPLHGPHTYHSLFTTTPNNSLIYRPTCAVPARRKSPTV